MAIDRIILPVDNFPMIEGSPSHDQADWQAWYIKFVNYDRQFLVLEDVEIKSQLQPETVHETGTPSKFLVLKGPETCRLPNECYSPDSLHGLIVCKTDEFQTAEMFFEQEAEKLRQA